MESAANDGSRQKSRTKTGAKYLESIEKLHQAAGDGEMGGQAPLRRSRSQGDFHPDGSPTETASFEGFDGFESLRESEPLKEFELLELLHLAAAEGRDDYLSSALSRMDKARGEYKLSVNSKGKSWPSWTALHHGASNNHKGVLEVLLKRPEIDVDVRDSKGNTALLIASGRGHTAAVQTLLTYDAAIRIWNEKGLSCLSTAASNGHVDVVKTLLECLEEHEGSTVNEFQGDGGFRFIQSNDTISPKWTTLHHASAHSQEEVLKLLLDNPHIGTVDVQAEDGSTALILASEEGNEGVVRMLLNSKADPALVNSNGWNCLHSAAFEGYDKVVGILLRDARLRQGLNTQDANGNTALMLAAQKGHKLIVEDLLRYLPDVHVANKERWTCLHLAADGSHNSVIKSMLNMSRKMSYKGRKSLINAQGGRSGDTALIIASRKGNADAVKMLLTVGADPLICNKDKYSCVHAAAEGGHHSVLKQLLQNEKEEEYGYDPLSYKALEAESAVFFGPETPLLVRSTSKKRSPEVAFVKMMGQRTSSSGRTALHSAAQAQQYAVILQLLKAYFALVLKIHGFARHPSDRPLVRKFLLLLFHCRSTRRSADSEKSMKKAYDSDTEDWISKSDGHDEIREDLLQYWMSLESNHGAGDWKIVILKNFFVSHGEETYFVEKFVDAYMKLVDYSNSKDRYGRTFLHYIADQELPSGHETHSEPPEDCLPRLVPRVVAVDAKASDSNGDTREEVCLLRSVLGVVSVDVNASDSKGDTPLHLAMRRGNRCMLRYCLVPGRVLNLEKKNAVGTSVLDLAFRNSCLELERPGSIRFDPNLDAFKELEKVLIERVTDTSRVARAAESGQDTYSPKILPEMICLFLKCMTERVSHRQDGAINPEQHAKRMETFRKENHYGGLTLLHYLAFRGLSNDLEFLLNSKSSAFSRLVNRSCKINKWTPLHYAVDGGHFGVVKVLLNEESKARTTEKDNRDETPLGIAIARKLEFQKSKDSRFDVFKDIEQLLLKDSEVSAYKEKLLSDRQVLGDASNAILVGASVIASVTFAGWLQPPLGYVDYHLFAEAGPPPGSTESFVAVANYPAVRVFWVFNSLSFFFAIATVICGAGAMVQTTSASSYYIRKEVRLMRLWLRMTSTLLAISIMCVLGAFAAAGFAVLPPSAKYRTSMIVTASIGIPTCVICLFLLFMFSRVVGFLRVLGIDIHRSSLKSP